MSFLIGYVVVFKVILAGKKETVALAMQKADGFRTELLRRGVLLVPVVWGERKTPEVEKKRGFGASSKTAATSLPSIGVINQKDSILERVETFSVIFFFFFFII